MNAATIVLGILIGGILWALLSLVLIRFIQACEEAGRSERIESARRRFRGEDSP